MQTKGTTQRVEQSACRKESQLALACASSHPPENKSACDALFQSYKDFRKLDLERVIRERVEKRKSAF